MISNFFNGKFGLAKTYWFGVVGFGILARLAFRYVNYLYLVSDGADSLARTEVLHKGLSIAAIIIALLLLRAMVKAGFDSRTPGGWGWLGIAIALANAVSFVFVTATVFFPSLPTPRFMMQLEIANFNRQLPQVMNDDVTMTSVKIIDDDLVYFVDVNFAIPEENIGSVQEALSMDSVDGVELCQDSSGYFRGGIKSLVYEYKYTNTSVRASLDGNKCLNYLDEK